MWNWSHRFRNRNFGPGSDTSGVVWQCQSDDCKIIALAKSSRSNKRHTRKTKTPFLGSKCQCNLYRIIHCLSFFVLFSILFVRCFFYISSFDLMEWVIESADACLQVSVRIFMISCTGLCIQRKNWVVKPHQLQMIRYFYLDNLCFTLFFTFVCLFISTISFSIKHKKFEFLELYKKMSK